MILDEPDQVKCQGMLSHAVKMGRMKAADACEGCGCADKRLHGHHADYTKPYEVEWLCPKCHGARHAKGSNLVQVGLRLPPPLLKAVDADRGDVPRNRYIVRLLEGALGVHESAEGEPGRASTPERADGAVAAIGPAPSAEGLESFWGCLEAGCSYEGSSVAICPEHDRMVSRQVRLP